MIDAVSCAGGGCGSVDDPPPLLSASAVASGALLSPGSPRRDPITTSRFTIVTSTSRGAQAFRSPLGRIWRDRLVVLGSP